MSDDTKILHVYQAGPLTVVGFAGQELLDQVNIATCRDEIKSLVAECETKILAFDLSGVRLIPSGLLGLLTSLKDLGVEVQIYNPSDDVREVLEITKLDRVIPVQEVDLDGSSNDLDDDD